MPGGGFRGKPSDAEADGDTTSGTGFSGDEWDFTRVCRVLIHEPHSLRLAEIGKLNPWIVRELYFTPPEDSQEEGEVQSPKEVFWAVWRARRLPEREIEAKWREECQRRGFRVEGDVDDE